MEIKEATREEIEKIPGFDMYSEDNEGEDIFVAYLHGEAVAFVQGSGNQINFLQAVRPGTGGGRALVEFWQEGCASVVADNVHRGCEGFWRKMGFQKSTEGQWEWSEEEEDEE